MDYHNPQSIRSQKSMYKSQPNLYSTRLFFMTHMVRSFWTPNPPSFAQLLWCCEIFLANCVKASSTFSLDLALVSIHKAWKSHHGISPRNFWAVPTKNGSSLIEPTKKKGAVPSNFCWDEKNNWIKWDTTCKGDGSLGKMFCPSAFSPILLLRFLILVPSNPTSLKNPHSWG